ncbi:MAG: hypothetical protein QM820_30275 [Minicystis sp.]
MATYKITINMTPTTAKTLFDNGYSLYAFKGVRVGRSAKGGAPLVWFSTTTFAPQTVVSWEEQYQGYVSQNAIIPQGTVTASASYDMHLGSTLEISDATGFGVVVDGKGPANAISLHNNTQFPFPSSGISQLNDTTKEANPLCAFPLFGGNLSSFAPMELVLLQFATQVVNTGAVIYQSFAPAALFDLTVENELTISYDINNNWLTTDPNVTLLPAGADLTPQLLRPSPSLSKSTVAAFQRATPKAEAPRASGVAELKNGGLAPYGEHVRA